jgi:hypothetical protein
MFIVRNESTIAIKGGTFRYFRADERWEVL